MSLIQHPFLKVPFEDVLRLYNNEVLPRLTKKNKVISISVAVVLSLVYYITDKVLKPPKNIRHIPYISYFSPIKSLLTRESIWDRGYRVHIPEIDKKNHGIFIERSRLGWVVQVSNPKDAKRVFLKMDLFPKLIPGNDHTDTLITKFLGGPNILAANGTQWKSQRSIANPAFHRSMPVKLFGSLTQELFKKMETMDETVNVSDLMERWTLDALGKAGFDFDFNAIRDKESEWVRRYTNINDGLGDPKIFIFPILDTRLRWLLPKRVQIHKELEIFVNMLDKIIKKKRETIKNGTGNDSLEENEKDLLSLLMESEESGEGVLTDEELVSNLCVFFFAGHDTTASALSFAIHHLAQNQDIQQRAREEAIEILGDEPCDVLPTIAETKKMTYINQIIKETLRLSGPVTRLPPRIATEDTELNDIFIPKGTSVTVNLFNIHHSEKIWKNPKKFDPERFAEGGEASSIESMGWTPFGNGGRQCIGMNFSLNEQRVILSMLLRKFTWSTPENSIHRDGAKTSGIIVIGPHDLDITFKKIY